MTTLIQRNRGNGAPEVWGEADNFDRWFDRMMTPWLRGGVARIPNGEAAVFAPPVDITHDQNEVVLRAELPGVKKEDIELVVHDDTLTLKGTKKTEYEEKEGRYQYVERRYGEFFRTFTLPAAVDENKVTAEFKDGILEIHMPIAETAKPRKIEIGK